MLEANQLRSKPDGAHRRIIEVRCGWRPCAVKNDSIVQSRNADGTWGPDVAKLLVALGWVTQDVETDGVKRQVLFCSKHCAHLHSYHAARGLAPKAVEKIDDVQYAETVGKSPERVRSAVASSDVPAREPPPLLGPKARPGVRPKVSPTGKDPRAA